MRHGYGIGGRAFKAALLVVVAGALAAGPVGAAVLRTVQYTVTAPTRSERWNAVLNVPLFDPHLGTLRQVTLRLDGRVEGSARFENLDARPLSVTQTLGTLLDLRTPTLATLLQCLPLRKTSDDAASFDGATDYAGASGRTHPGLSADQRVEVQLVAAAELRLFTGTGTLPLTLLSRPSCGGTGTGNFAQFFTTRSSGVLTVIYGYEAAPVPVQPVTWSHLKLLGR